MNIVRPILSSVKTGNVVLWCIVDELNETGLRVEGTLIVINSRKSLMVDNIL